MTLKLLIAVVASVLFIGSVSILNGCSRHEITPAQARLLAWERIIAAQKPFHYDANRLPCLHMEERADSYYFYVNDPKQNVQVTAFVFKGGGVSVSAVALSRLKAWENGGNVMLVPPGVTVPPAVSAANAQSSGP